MCSGATEDMLPLFFEASYAYQVVMHTVPGRKALCCCCRCYLLTDSDVCYAGGLNITYKQASHCNFEELKSQGKILRVRQNHQSAVAEQMANLEQKLVEMGAQVKVGHIEM